MNGSHVHACSKTWLDQWSTNAAPPISVHHPLAYRASPAFVIQHIRAILSIKWDGQVAMACSCVNTWIILNIAGKGVWHELV